MDRSDGMFEKLELVMGRAGVDRLAEATVMVVGLGGVGSNCIEALARGGVGHLVVIDHDVVQESNINRQAIAFRSTVGRKKADAVRAMVADINPAAQVEALDMFVTAEDAPRLLEAYRGKVDYVVDAIDTVSSKLAIAEYADCTGMRLISSMGAANKLRTDCFRFADVYDTANCPLCRVMRREGRKRGIRRLRVLYSFEQPVRIAAGVADVPGVSGASGAVGSAGGRAPLGTASYVPPIMGQMIAGEVLRELARVGEFAERDA